MLKVLSIFFGLKSLFFNFNLFFQKSVPGWEMPRPCMQVRIQKLAHVSLIKVSSIGEGNCVSLEAVDAMGVQRRLAYPTLLGRQNTDSSVTICSTKFSSDAKSGNSAMFMPTCGKKVQLEKQILNFHLRIFY
jgi:hypothetical protein